MLVKGGATVMFSEVTEVRDGVYLLGERCVNEEVGRKLAAEMKWYDHYLEMGQVDRSANPTPGNKKGGLSNIVEKAMGIHCQVRIIPHRGGALPGGEAVKARPDLCGHPRPATLSAAPVSWPAASACRYL